MKQKVLIALMFAQILIIFYLGIKIYQEKSNILGVRIVAPVDEELSFFNRDSNFKYFYELKPGCSATLDNHLLENTMKTLDWMISIKNNTFPIEY